MRRPPQVLDSLLDTSNDVHEANFKMAFKEHGDMARVIRSCGWEKYPRECYENDDEDHNERVCQCFTDGCNSRASPNSLRPMAVVGIPLLVILYRAF
ncbi:hypothetical protein C0J52_10220 [Blattella germanica]|nr:hypothetical protein C0J52_10220 [Blattella germanica]